MKSGREGCFDKCESVSHVLWECPAYNIRRSYFTAKLQDFLGEGFQEFQALDSKGKSSFVLGSELWEENFSSLLELVKGYVLRIWELRKGSGTIILTFSSPRLRVHLEYSQGSLWG